MPYVKNKVQNKSDALDSPQNTTVTTTTTTLYVEKGPPGLNRLETSDLNNDVFSRFLENVI